MGVCFCRSFTLLGTPVFGKSRSHAGQKRIRTPELRAKVEQQDTRDEESKTRSLRECDVLYRERGGGAVNGGLGCSGVLARFPDGAYAITLHTRRFSGASARRRMAQARPNSKRNS
jgi:hypothetical protein